MQNMQKRKAFTIVELITVVSIIALLMAIVMPALSAAKRQARKVACKSIITALETGVEQFRTDHGFYPPSSVEVQPLGTSSYNDMNSSGPVTNTGSHRLAEAMFGFDQLGYQENRYYAIATAGVNAGKPVDASGNLVKRSSNYIATDNLNISTLPNIAADGGFTPAGTFTTSGGTSISVPAAWQNYNPIITDGLKGDMSLPFLYFKASKRGVFIESRGSFAGIYNFDDNRAITTTAFNGSLCDEILLNSQPTFTNETVLNNFAYYTWDQRTAGGSFVDAGGSVSFAARPYKKDSFIIMSAGLDGIFGLDSKGKCDDICNFEPVK